jgi:hypothetical protein
MNNPQDTPVVKPAVTPAEYNALVAAAQLQDIRLVKSAFELAPEGIEVRPEWKFTHACEIDQMHFDAAKSLLIASVSAEANAEIGEQGSVSHHTMLSITCQYVVFYSVTGSPSDAAIDSFARRVARFAAYPYFRAHVAELASQAGLQLPPLPVIRERRLIPSEPPLPAPKLEGTARKAVKSVRKKKD